MRYRKIPLMHRGRTYRQMENLSNYIWKGLILGKENNSICNLLILLVFFIPFYFSNFLISSSHRWYE